MADLTPNALHDTPALIEAVFPAQKVSFEAQRERKAGPAQTLTGLGSYWKGRKPLILVRAVLLGCLLPQTDNSEKDLEIFEKLMAFDDEGLARRALIQNTLKPKEIAARINLDTPWNFFSHNIKKDDPVFYDIEAQTFPMNCAEKGINIRWRRDISEQDKLLIYHKTLNTISSYTEKASHCKRPEEVDQTWLYKPVWPAVNSHYAHLGLEASSHQELIEKLGILRFGHRPQVGDTFCGGGSIPFEAARLGCDVYASDLNPIACMLTWSAINIIGADPEQGAEIEKSQREVAEIVDKEIIRLGIEHDKYGNRAKAYLYCLEARCPETGWMVPMAPSWVISKGRSVIAKLIPDYNHKRFDIKVLSGVSATEMIAAEQGTVKDGALVYELNGKTHFTPIKTLRGDYRDLSGNTYNQLRHWEKNDFKPRQDDIFQERLYAVQWITRETLDQGRKEYFFTEATPNVIEKENAINEIVKLNLNKWQVEGLVPDMAIEPGAKTDEPIRTRGWTHWHHLFTPRQLLLLAILQKAISRSDHPEFTFYKIANTVNWICKLCLWATSPARATGGPGDNSVHVFYNQALNTPMNYASRSWIDYMSVYNKSGISNSPVSQINFKIKTINAQNIDEDIDVYITDPPYADAVHYHEITEFFIAWLRKNPPPPFDKWTWDSRRALAIKGSGDDFRRGMVDAYSAMANHMPDNGIQCVMFTHQDTAVWSDMVGIFWAAGLQVMGAWYIATETTSELKKGGYVQGTVILVLRKRSEGEKSGFKQRILPAVRNEVKTQIEQMMHLNEEVEIKMGEPVFNDSDLQMAGYAAALKVLTAYTHVGGEDVTSFALRPRQRGETTVVDEIVQQAAEAANSLLVPEGLGADTWHSVSGIQRFYLRMMDMETTGASKLDNYQNFAKAFRVTDYTKVMGNMTANKARLKRISEFSSRDLTDITEFGNSWLGRVTIGLQQLLSETEPQIVISQLQADLPEFMEIRPVLIDLLEFIQNKAPETEVREVAEILANRLRNLRALGQ